MSMNSQDGPRQRFWSIGDAARSFSVSDSKVRLFIKSGRLRAVKIGGRVLIADEELDRFMKELIDATPRK